MSPSASPAAASTSPPKFKRHARNYLLDSKFQLKYTSYIVGLTLVISIALGFLLYRQTQKTVDIGNDAVAVGTDANKAGQEAVAQSDALNTKLEMDAMKGYGDNPTLIDAVKEANKAETDAIKARADNLTSMQARLENQRKLLGEQRTILLATLAGALTLLVVFVGLAGIVFTHRVAGPIFKMKRLLREVGEGKLEIQGRLRKGDELHEFFEVFATMVEKLRTRQESEIETLDGAIALATKANADEALVTKLKGLRDYMQKALDHA